MIETATAWTLAESAGYRREPARPSHLRPVDFEDLFDARTVFYDCFRISPVQVMLVGPPLVRFPGVLSSLKISTATGQCPYRVEHKFTRAFGNRQTHNLCRVLVDAPAGLERLQVQCSAGDTVLHVAPSAWEMFRGKRVLLTLSRNNDPVWICDWMRFHRDVHQADAVLLYDNGSTAYSPPQLLQAMKRVAGFATVTVVAWPYKYGPQGMGRGTWDSAFCQDGALEDARWRFLGEAYAVLSCDIDELVLSSQGSIFDLAADSAGGYVKFAGRWVSSRPHAGSDQVSATPVDLPRHRDSTYQVLPRWQWKDFMLKDLYLSPPKWAAAPARCPRDAQWSVHEIVGMKARTKRLTTACYRHFEKITTHWKKTRAKMEGSAEVILGNDHALEQAFRMVRWSE